MDQQAVDGVFGERVVVDGEQMLEITAALGFVCGVNGENKEREYRERGRESARFAGCAVRF